jgi:phosphoglycolate phosphatase-like HAD superfamily hydrolase
MTRQTVIFDLDGTLADTMPDLVAGLAAILDGQLQAGGRSAREVTLDLMQLPPRQMMERFIELTDWPASRIQLEFSRITTRLPARLFPEVSGVLVALKQAGYTIMISSNNPESTLPERLVQVGIAQHCDFMLGTILEQGITKNDHPRVAAERLGISPEELAATGAYVGDMPTDMQLAREAGLLAIGRLTGSNADALIGAGAHHVITDLTQLKPLLR